jgi:sugar phosphate isomerase/epimerase
MKLGVFTFYFPYGVNVVAERIARLGFECVQLNPVFADWELTSRTTAADCRRIAESFSSRGLPVAAIAGYRNPIAPDRQKQAANLAYLRLLLERAADLGTPYVSTEAGSRHPSDDWAPHPDNATPEAMALLIDRVGELAEHARRHGSVIVVEPAVGTLLDTPAKVQTLSDALPSPGLGFLADWPNFIDGSNFDRASEVLAAMTGSWLKRVPLAHLKDVCPLQDPPRERHHHMADPKLYGNMEYPGPGRGTLDLAAYFRHLSAQGYDGPMIIEHTAEDDLPAALEVARRARTLF